MANGKKTEAVEWKATYVGNSGGGNPKYELVGEGLMTFRQNRNQAIYLDKDAVPNPPKTITLVITGWEL